jgi:hypothetical protein
MAIFRRPACNRMKKQGPGYSGAQMRGPRPSPDREARTLDLDIGRQAEGASRARYIEGS